MPLESGDYISDLNASNPLGVGDPKAQGDDHLRLIKHVLLTTFPAIAGAVTPSHTELNYVDGVTSSIQTQLDGKAASSHNHSAADLTSGTIPDARFPSTLPAVNGSALTNLNASNLASGSVADARLSSNVPLKNAANTFTASQTISGAATLLSLSSSNQSGGYVQFGLNGATRGYFGNGALVNTGGDGDISLRVESGGFFFSGNAGTTAHFKLDSSGRLSTPGASAQEVGTAGVIARAVSSSSNTDSTDCGKCIVFTGGSGQTFTLDSDPPTNSVVVLVNESGNSWTIAASSSLIFAGATGSRTLPNGCMAAAYHRAGGGVWQIAGQVT